MVNAYYTSGSCSNKIDTFTYLGDENMLYNLDIEFMIYLIIRKSKNLSWRITLWDMTIKYIIMN